MRDKAHSLYTSRGLCVLLIPAIIAMNWQSILYLQAAANLTGSIAVPYNSDSSCADDNDGFAFVFIRNLTTGPISGCTFCLPAKSVQADEASWSISVLSVFPVTREALSLIDPGVDGLKRLRLTPKLFD